MKKFAVLNENQKFALTHCLQIAAERFDEDVKVLREEADDMEKKAAAVEAEGGKPQFSMMTPRGARHVAETLEHQAKVARQLMHALTGGGDVILKDPDEDSLDLLELVDRV